MWVIILLLALFFAAMVAVGIFCRRRASTVDGFVLGGRSVGPWLTAFAFGTSYFSAVIFVGYAGKFGWNFGLASTWIGLGNAFIGSLLAWVILGRRTRIMTQALGVKTMPDFFGVRYASRPLKVAAALIVFVFLIPYTASLYNGLSRLFDMAFGLDYVWCVLLMAAFTCLYVLLGGYMATAITDFLQGLIMLGGIVTVIAAVLHTKGGYMAATSALAETAGWEYTSLFGPDPFYLVVVVLLTSLGTWGLPQMVGKFYAIKDEGAIHRGTVISTLFAIVVAGGCYFLGGYVRLYSEVNESGSPVIGFDALIPKMLESLSPLLIGVVLLLVLSASMSTLSSLVLTSSSTMTLDLILPSMKKEKQSEKRVMLIIRILTAVFIAVSAVIAIFQIKSDNATAVSFIADLMGVSWGALAGSFLAPFLYGLYSKKTSKAAVWTSFAIGVSLSLAQLILSLADAHTGIAFLDDFIFRSSLHSGVFAMVLGLILVPLISHFTRPKDTSRVEDIFSCYDDTRTVGVTDSLGSKG